MHLAYHYPGLLSTVVAKTFPGLARLPLVAKTFQTFEFNNEGKF
jgi:hypothetical protein